MQISISGSNRVGLKRHRVEQATKFFINTLLPKERSKDLYIWINFADMHDETYGMCEVLSDLYDQPNEFRIWVSPIQNDCVRIPFLRILAHELVHLKQYANNELANSRAWIWKGTRYKFVENSLSYDEYAALPWEEEAIRLEEELYNDYLAYVNRFDPVNRVKDILEDD